MPAYAGIPFFIRSRRIAGIAGIAGIAIIAIIQLINSGHEILAILAIDKLWQFTADSLDSR
jgi:hypothetical protein